MHVHLQPLLINDILFAPTLYYILLLILAILYSNSSITSPKIRSVKKKWVDGKKEVGGWTGRIVVKILQIIYHE